MYLSLEKRKQNNIKNIQKSGVMQKTSSKRYESIIKVKRISMDFMDDFDTAAS